MGFDPKTNGYFQQFKYVGSTKSNMTVLQKKVLESGATIEIKIFRSAIIGINMKGILCRCSIEHMFGNVYIRDP